MNTGEKITEKVTEIVSNKVEEIVKEGTPVPSTEKEELYNFSNSALRMWSERDKRIDYNRSHIYGDVAYKDNLKGDREVVGRVGFLYYPQKWNR